MDLICLPHAGGGAGLFQGWRTPAGLRIHPVCYPGREARISEPLFSTLDPLLDWIEQELADVLQRPHIIFGHSMGAAVGHALCQRRLRAKQNLPLALGISACLPPSLRVPRDLHNLDDAALLQQLISFDPENTALAEVPELWAMMAPIIRADFNVIDGAQVTSEPTLPLPILTFAGRSDPMVSPTQMAAWAAEGQRVTPHVFDGGHFYLRTAAANIVASLYKTGLTAAG
jgi:surfactin synthase thioesterase subunit